jgi:DNA-directed RNA polymerase specialized sigma24 family protein
MRFTSPVPYVPASEDRKIELEEAIRRANTIVQDQAKKTGTDCDSVRSLIMAGKCDLSPECVDEVRAAKDLEWEALCAFSNLVAKIVNRWASKTHDPSLSSEDLANEAFAAAVKATRGFTQDGIKLSTFLHVCVTRRLSELCMKSGPVSRIPRSVAKMKMQYMALASEEGANFDSIVQKMSLSEKRVGELVFALKGVVAEANEEDGGMRVVDESARMMENPISEKAGIMSVVDALELSELEKAVLEGFLCSGGKMGLSSVSKHLINPNTKKPYSRMAFSLAWTRVKDKIAKAYADAA